MQPWLAVFVCTASLLSALNLAACSRPGPPRGPCEPNKKPLGSICGFENPEDVAYSPQAASLVSSQIRFGTRGGFLMTLVPGESTPRRAWPTGASDDFDPNPAVGDATCTAPDAGALIPHGIAFDQNGWLYVVNHGGREAVEIFSLRGRGDELRLAWRSCIELPPRTAGNDVAIAPDGEVFVSNYMPSWRSTLGNLKIALGMKTGDVIAWRRASGWRHVPGTEASAANGVAISPDGKFLYYAETGGGRVVRVDREGKGRVEAPLPGLPDNLSWTPRGTLYVASHDSALKFVACSRSLPCRAPWHLFEIAPDTMAVTEVLSDDGSVVGAVSSAQEALGKVYLGAVFDDRIGVWTRP